MRCSEQEGYSSITEVRASEQPPYFAWLNKPFFTGQFRLGHPDKHIAPGDYARHSNNQCKRGLNCQVLVARPDIYWYKSTLSPHQCYAGQGYAGWCFHA
jgi:hypothetical protein